MILLDISGNEIHGKEVVFERFCNTGGYTEPLALPEQFTKIIHLGNTINYDIFSCYVNGKDILALSTFPFIHFGQLKDKI